MSFGNSISVAWPSLNLVTRFNECVSLFSSSDMYIVIVFDIPYSCHGNHYPPGSLGNPLPKRRGELEWIPLTILQQINEKRRSIEQVFSTK